MVKAFCALRARHAEDYGETINPIDHAQAWGAWASYFKGKGVSMALFNRRGQELASMSNSEQRAEKGFQVPAMLPSDFDEDWDFIKDRMAGDNFMAAQARKREEMSRMGLTPEGRADIVKAGLAKVRMSAFSVNSGAA